MRCVRSWSVPGVLFVLFVLVAARAAASDEPVLQGTVRDSSGGALVGATVNVEGETSRHRAQATTDERGVYRFFALPPDRYALRVEFPGFSTARQSATVAAARQARADVTLEIELTEQVEVAETLSLHDSPLTRTLTRKELALLPTDSRQMLQRLRELAGTRGLEGDVVIYVDGFREGLRLPPKETIDMVRISAHPFSAEFPEPGHARIEITTRPGSEKVTADVTASFNSDDLNAREYFAPTKPDSEIRHFTGYFATPVLPKKLSISLFGGRWSEDVTDVFNATVLDGTGAPQPVNGTLRAPTRIDSLLVGVNTLAGRRHTTRLLFGHTERRAENQGLDTAFDLPEHVFTRSTRETSGRGSLLSILAPSLLNEAHLEYTHRDYGHAAAATTPETLVLDAFHAGGRQDALFMDENRRSAQFRDTLTFGYKKLMMKAGVQAEFASTRLLDQSGFGGTFLFGSDVERDATGTPIRDAQGQLIAISPLERYRRTVLGTPGYVPSQFSIVTGDPRLSYSQWWLSWFTQNDWTVRQGMTLSFGARQEWQTYVGSRGDLAARVGLGWNIDSAGRNVVRAGAGIFYGRIGPELALDTTRYDGTHQREVVINRPDTYPELPAVDPAFPATIHVKAPDLAAPSTTVATVSYERALPGHLVGIVEYAHDRGEHLLLQRNINAPADDGTLPMPDSGPVLQYASLGESRSHQLLTSVRFNLEGKVTVMGGYRRTWSRATTDGFRTAPADPNDLGAEWGMPAADREHRGHLGATFYLPWDVYLSPYATASSGRPFNITTGRDANGDTLFAERPAFASPGDPGAIATPVGLLTLEPGPGATLIPRNFGRGRPEVRLDVHVSKLTRLSKRLRVTLACDVQNALNSGLFSAYYTVVTAPGFTEPNRALATRRVLFTARVSY